METIERIKLAQAYALDAYKSTVKRLKADIECLKRELDRALADCDAALNDQPHSINSCGIIQNLGLRIDQACSELRARGEAYRAMLHLTKE